MSTTTEQSSEGTARLIDTIGDAEKASLEAVRKFVDVVNDVFPDLGDDGPRRKVIDSAFKMTEQLVNASNQLAQNILGLTEETLRDDERASAPSSK